MEWRRRRRKDTEAASVAPETQNIAAATTPEETPEYAAAFDLENVDLTKLHQWMERVIRCRALITDIHIVLKEHVEQAHADVWECDTWCAPVLMARYLSMASRDELQDLAAVLLKDSFWNMNTVNQQTQE